MDDCVKYFGWVNNAVLDGKVMRFRLVRVLTEGDNDVDHHLADALYYHQRDCYLEMTEGMGARIFAYFYPFFKEYYDAFLLEKSDTGRYRYMFLISTLLTMLSPENYQMWNLRRELVILGYIRLDIEILYLNLILDRLPKTCEVWEYRKWLIQRYESIPFEVLEKEFLMSQYASDIHPRNYYAWSYRLFLVQLIVKNESKEYIERVMHFENENLLSLQVLDPSALHYQNYLNSISV